MHASDGIPRCLNQLCDHSLLCAYVMEQIPVQVTTARDALDDLKQILRLTKDEPDYHAMYAWLLMKLNPNDDGPLEEMMESIQTALELFEDHEKANLQKAQILRRMGKPREALRLFRKVVEINPRNTEAAREVRIATMRTKEKDDGGKFGGLGKLFRKKKSN